MYRKHGDDGDNDDVAPPNREEKTLQLRMRRHSDARAAATACLPGPAECLAGAMQICATCVYVCVCVCVLFTLCCALLRDNSISRARGSHCALLQRAAADDDEDAAER